MSGSGFHCRSSHQSSTCPSLPGVGGAEDEGETVGDVAVIAALIVEKPADGRQRSGRVTAEARESRVTCSGVTQPVFCASLTA